MLDFVLSVVVHAITYICPYSSNLYCYFEHRPKYYLSLPIHHTDEMLHYWVYFVPVAVVSN